MKRAAMILAVVLFVAMTVSSAYAASQIYGQTELIYCDKTKVFPGYVIWATGGYGWMVDIDGNLIHKWTNTGLGLYPDGHRLAQPGNAIRELDWDGNVYLQWTNAARPEVRPHHDRVRIFNKKLNKNTVLAVVSYRDLTYQIAVDNGSAPDNPITVQNAPYDDGVIEFDDTGNIIWEWRFWNHAIQNYDPTKGKYGDPYAPENWGKLDINVDTNTRKGLAPDWNHVNSMDYNADLDQIIVNSREHGEIYVIDHNTTTQEAAGPKGDFVWRWGNPANYGQGDIPTFNRNGHEQLFGAHNIHWIPAGLHGAGNLLIFENGSYRPCIIAHSSIFEINPYDGPMQNGVYIWEKDAGYTDDGSGGLNMIYGQLSKQVVWAYSSKEYGQWSKGMFSAHISGTQRLPNGNTIMCAGEEGHFVEVTSDEKVVWEYVSPILSATNIVKRLGPGQASSVFRCYKYGLDYTGFAGLDLTPKGQITDYMAEPLNLLDDALNAILPKT